MGAGSCFGAVDYAYRIAKYEVTNAQYAEFLNAKAASDPLGLYNTDMARPGRHHAQREPGQLHATASSPAARTSRSTIVSYFDAIRFANWLHNGQGNGDTETGAYTLLGGTPTPSNPLVERNPGATIFLPTEDEWYKAAYYDAALGELLRLPDRHRSQIVCSAPTATPNRANCGGAAGDFTDVGSYTGSPSPNGTFDQGGNVSEWADSGLGILEQRPYGAGTLGSPGPSPRRDPEYDDPWFESGGIGFRVASLEEAPAAATLTCDERENPLTCPADCPAVCGDGLCSGDENAAELPGRLSSGLRRSPLHGQREPDQLLADCGFCGDDICEPPRASPAAGGLRAGVRQSRRRGHGAVRRGRARLAPPARALASPPDPCPATRRRVGTTRSGCFKCKPRLATCTKDSECCSDNCRLRRCR